MGNPEYRRRSMTLREEKSAYDGMRKEVVFHTTSRVAPQVDISSCPSSLKTYWDRIFCFHQAENWVPT